MGGQFNDRDGDGVLDGGDPAGGGILTPLVVRNNPGTAGPDANYLRYTGDEHVVLGGTAGNDILLASEGDDTLFGDDGNDTMEGGAGNDIFNSSDERRVGKEGVRPCRSRWSQYP